MLFELRQMIGNARRWAARKIDSHRASVIIDRSGWKTDRPKVDVSVCGRGVGYFGAMTVFEYAADEIGEATATMHARTLAEITGLPLFDRRGAHNAPNGGK